MPPGNTRTQPPAKVIERLTAEACLELALSVQRTRHLEGDEAGSDAASQVARLIQEELLKGASDPRLKHPAPDRGRFQNASLRHH